jgi:hypothetical protein
MAEVDLAAAPADDADSNPRPVYSHRDPRRMQLSARERALAIGIKEAIASTAEMDPVSDFMCAQLALIDGDDTEAALQRVYHLQCLKEEYGIFDTVQDGKAILVEYVEMMPKTLLCFTYCKDTGQYIMMYDNTKFDGSRMTSEKHVRIWMGAMYYTLQTLCPDFEAIRCGSTLVFENEG